MEASMAVATGEIYQCTIQMLSDGQTVENVLHMRARTGTRLAEELREGMRDFWDIYRTVITDNVLLTSLIIKQITPVAFDTFFALPHDGNSSGNVSDAPLNLTVAVVSTLRTGVAGKTHRGRIYTPGVSTAWVLEGQNRLGDVRVNSFVTMWGDVMTAFGDADGTDPNWAIGIYSRLIGGTSPATVAGWQAVTEIVPHAILGNQRRRRVGVGV
jgi:hypothetical protein